MLQRPGGREEGGLYQGERKSRVTTACTGYGNKGDLYAFEGCIGPCLSRFARGLPQSSHGVVVGTGKSGNLRSNSEARRLHFEPTNRTYDCVVQARPLLASVQDLEQQGRRTGINKPTAAFSSLSNTLKSTWPCSLLLPLSHPWSPDNVS